MPSPTPHHIARIGLVRLFGRYSYDLPREGESFTDLNILYGENGLGKTTLLTLVFHLLSPSRTRSHRTSLSGIPFQSLSVTLNDGTRITAGKDEQLLTGPVKFGIYGRTRQAEWTFFPNSPTTVRLEDLPESVSVAALPKEIRADVQQALAERSYFEELAKIEVTAYMLTSDRILLADTLEPIERERRPPRPAESARARLAEIVAEQRIGAVTQALSSASSWLQRKFVERSYGAAESASKVYESVIARIATTPYKTSEGLSKTQQNQLREEMTTRIQSLNKQSREFATFGLAQFGISPSVLDTMRSATGNKLHLIERVLRPHIDELEARLTSIEPFYSLVSGFVSNVNKFFRDKSIGYSLRHGLRIFSTEQKPNEIVPSQLSSGEQQLILIFCNVLTARDTPSIFIIDEPEISLNILWQRMLVTSLQELSSGSQTQFLFASHSMEILAKHRNRVVALEE